MKKIILLLTITTLFKAQSNYYIQDSLKLDFKPKNNEIANIASTCASPTGSMNSIGAPPGSYAALQAGGYCNPSSYGKNGIVCWTFIPTGNSITINSGYSSVSCAGITFGPFNLYSCAPACAFLGSGLSFTVVPNQCYTWCMTYSGNGGLCNFTDFCPYYTQTVTPLPIDLISFNAYSIDNMNVIEWITVSERNNKYFELENSTDALKWAVIAKFEANNGNKEINYSYNDYEYKKTVNYYRLKQVNNDNSYKYFNIVSINNRSSKTISSIRILDILGNDVSNLMLPGIYIKKTIFNDSTIELKKIIIK